MPRIDAIGDGYWELGFGFNVTLPIELYINFGLFGLIPMCFAGLIFGAALKSFDSRVIYYGYEPSWELLKLYVIYTACNSLAGLQWSILFYAVYILTKLMFRRIRSKKKLALKSESLILSSRSAGDDAASLCMALQPPASTISLRQQSALASHEIMVPRQTRIVQEIATLPY